MRGAFKTHTLPVCEGLEWRPEMTINIQRAILMVFKPFTNIVSQLTLNAVWEVQRCGIRIASLSP